MPFPSLSMRCAVCCWCCHCRQSSGSGVRHVFKNIDFFHTHTIYIFCVHLFRLIQIFSLRHSSAPLSLPLYAYSSFFHYTILTNEKKTHQKIVNKSIEHGVFNKYQQIDFRACTFPLLLLHMQTNNSEMEIFFLFSYGVQPATMCIRKLSFYHFHLHFVCNRLLSSSSSSLVLLLVFLAFLLDLFEFACVIICYWK